jgi:CRISPR/Cas system CSM-associated protein Csm3 (group 7 of RAMP superfamily)
MTLFSLDRVNYTRTPRMANDHYTYTLSFRAPVSIFTGLGIAGLVDHTVVRKANRTMMRKADGLPYIPGSTVKGRLRFFAERVLRSSSPPAGLSLHGSNQPHCKAVDSACTLCRLFGNPAIPALLQVGQASLIPRWDTLFQELLKTRHNPVLRPDAEIRPGIALSRSRRTALPDHLFFDEAVPAVTFSAELTQPF